MVMFAAAVAAGMAASTGVRVPTAETLAAAKALRGMAASKALRRVPAAKHRAARARRLARRSRKALAQRGPVRRLTEIAALIACARRSITGLLPAYWELEPVTRLQRWSGIADSGRVTAAGAA